MSEMIENENNIIGLKQKHKEQRKKTENENNDDLIKKSKEMEVTIDNVMREKESELVILKDSVTQKIDRVMDIMSEKDHKVKEAIELDSN